MSKSPEEYVEYIDEQYLIAKKKKLSRLSVEWGKWSREMNLELRGRIESREDPEELRLKYVIVYWTLKSQLLELHHSKPHSGRAKKKKVAKEAKQIKTLILHNNLLKDFKLDAELTKKMLS